MESRIEPRAGALLAMKKQGELQRMGKPKSPGTCKHRYCRRPALRQGWCGLHYGRNRFGRAMDGPVRQKDGSQGCKVPGCLKPHDALGFCVSHYSIHYRGNDPMRPLIVKAQRGLVCSVPDCWRPQKAKGKCITHYNWERRGLDMGRPVGVRKKGRLCDTPGCAKPHRAKGMCISCYSKARKAFEVEHVV